MDLLISSKFVGCVCATQPADLHHAPVYQPPPNHLLLPPSMEVRNRLLLRGSRRTGRWLISDLLDASAPDKRGAKAERSPWKRSSAAVMILMISSLLLHKRLLMLPAGVSQADAQGRFPPPHHRF